MMWRYCYIGYTQMYSCITLHHKPNYRPVLITPWRTLQPGLLHSNSLVLLLPLLTSDSPFDLVERALSMMNFDRSSFWGGGSSKKKIVRGCGCMTLKF